MYTLRMRACLRQIYMCIIPTFCIIGIPLIIYGGVNIPYSLTKEEAWAAGVNQPQALEEKRRASVEYKQMLIGTGFFGTSMAMLAVCILTMWRCPTAVIEPEESETAPPDPSP
jgi:hypothetical protein